GCAVLRGEPTAPTIRCLGPDRDMHAMVSAVARIRQAHPDVRVVVAGPAVRVHDPAQADVFGFLGPVNHRRSAYANGQIVVLSSADASMPYALIEAMMCGRPTV